MRLNENVIEFLRIESENNALIEMNKRIETDLLQLKLTEESIERKLNEIFSNYDDWPAFPKQQDWAKAILKIQKEEFLL